MKCVNVSPDHLYVACCHENCTLSIKSVDNGETWQTIDLEQPPEGCWWSELYLWVVCQGLVLKFPYHPTCEEILKNDPEICAIKFDQVLKFNEGVLVFEVKNENRGNIYISKVYDDQLYTQPIAKSRLGVSSVAISADGCAVVLLYRRSFSEYQLWEFAQEFGWELHSTKYFSDFEYFEMEWLSLGGTRNARMLMWLTSDDKHVVSFDFSNGSLDWDFLDFLSRGPLVRVCYIAPNFLLLFHDEYLYVFNRSAGALSAALDFSEGRYLFRNVSFFYLPSKSLLTFVFPNETKCFKIHNLDSKL